MQPSVIEMRNICKVYETKTSHVIGLNDVSLCVCQGEFVAIVGPSGSGKSTLMNIVGCMDTPTRGYYGLYGVDVRTLSHSDLAYIRSRCLGFVFQSFNLLEKLTVVENVALPLKYSNCSRRHREALAIEAMRKASIGEELFDRKVNALSGGQMQRVAIARALVNDPPIVLADEPTGNLDTKTGASILKTFRELNMGGKTIIVITHDMRVAENVHRVIEVQDGMLVGGGHECLGPYL